MQYLLMCCFDEKAWMSLPDAERGAIMSQYGKLIATIKQNGQLVAGAKLHAASSAVTVRHKNGKPALTDGPFAETKEQLGGYHLVECRDLDEALALAKQIPTLPAGGAVEVRALLQAE